MKKNFSAEEADYICCSEVTFQCFQKFGAFYTGENLFTEFV